MKIVNVETSTTLADRAELASGLIQRAVGLLGRKHLEQGEGLIIRPCNSVHTFFMRFPIDVIFLDKQGRAIKLLPDLAPFRLSPIVFGSSLVIELPAGTIERSGTKAQDRLALVAHQPVESGGIS
ncbi:MAG: DUF192 domain-containing protein [Chloroflexi bacterium]|nr:DUF192 domain-containing protein [Chloroflexota bacterium]